MAVEDIVSVWSSFGHTFIGAGEYEHGHDGEVLGIYHDCLTCGAHYVLRETPDAPNDGAYEANNGDDPTPCSGDTSMVHGDPREQEHGLDCEHGCSHCTHPCNCIICDH